MLFIRPAELQRLERSRQKLMYLNKRLLYPGGRKFRSAVRRLYSKRERRQMVFGVEVASMWFYEGRMKLQAVT